MGVTNKYYVKIFSLIDAKKSKMTTDRACGLSLNGQWAAIGQPDPAAAPGSSTDAPTSSSGSSSLPESPLTSHSLPSVSSMRSRKPRQVRGGWWCLADEIVLVKAYTELPPEGLYGGWIRILEAIKDDLLTRNRTAVDLKDKIRNLQKNSDRWAQLSSSCQTS
jgi:hypothetical protein